MNMRIARFLSGGVTEVIRPDVRSVPAGLVEVATANVGLNTFLVFMNDLGSSGMSLESDRMLTLPVG